MVTGGWELSLAVSLLLLAPSPAGALSAGIKTQSSTRYLSYDDPFQDKNRGDLLQYQYVKFSAMQIDAADSFPARPIFSDNR